MTNPTRQEIKFWSIRHKLKDMCESIKEFLCLHRWPVFLNHPTWKSKYDEDGWPMDEYKTTCEKCWKDFTFYF